MDELVPIEAYHSNSKQAQDDVEGDHFFMCLIEDFFEKAYLSYCIEVPKRLSLFGLHSEVSRPRT